MSGKAPRSGCKPAFFDNFNRSLRAFYHSNPSRPFVFNKSTSATALLRLRK